MSVPGHPGEPDASAAATAGVEAPNVGVQGSARNDRTLALFAIALTLAALMMFLVEPMVAKMVLPLLGGAPSVWNTCILFFQGMLLAGYAYVHAGQRLLGPGPHVILHAGLLGLSLLLIGESLRIPGSVDSTDPVKWLLSTLLKSIGLPFFLIASTAPLLQRWFSGTRHQAAEDPYFLYAASNAGSLLGLVAYPLLVEPTLPIRLQAQYWKYGYIAFALTVLACALQFYRAPRATRGVRAASSAHLEAERQPILLGRRLRWVALSFVPSSLMLAVTAFISTDVAAVPLLWVVPLALYLSTFIFAFGVPSDRLRGLADRAFPVSVLLLVLLLILEVTGPLSVVIPAHLAAFFVVALICHRELADNRPVPMRLTEFYLLVALGGALGSLFNTLVAPAVFTGIVEYPLVLVLACALRASSGPRQAGDWRWAGPVAVGLTTGALLIATAPIASATARFALLGIPAFLALSLSRMRVSFAAAIAAMLAAAALQPDPQGSVLHAERTFFGAYKVRLEHGGGFRTLTHGTTLHGTQSVSPELQSEALSYYHRTGPLGDVFATVPAASNPKIAVVGLGVGSVAAYRTGGQAWTFFEIDPVVGELARKPEYFTYLDDCGSACRITIGDARQSLAADTAEYGVLVLDAFSSDAIPVHLITREALAVYLKRLTPGGILVFHISNRYLNLEPVLARLADDAALVAMIRRDMANIDEIGKSGSEWLVMARRLEDLGKLPADRRWRRAAPGSAEIWTDDFSNILGLLVQH